MFTDRQTLVIQTMAMRMDVPSAMDWMEKRGQKISRDTYYKDLKKLSTRGQKRKFELMGEGLWVQHLERIDTLEIVIKLSWENYHHLANGKEYLKAQKVLDSIADMQPLLSQYYEASQGVIEYDRTQQAKGNLQHNKPAKAVIPAWVRGTAILVR